MRGVVRQLAACALGGALIATVTSACRRATDFSVLGRDAVDQSEFASPARELTGTAFLDTPVGSTLRALLPSDFRYWSTASEPIVLLGRTDARSNGAGGATGAQRSWRVEDAVQRATLSTQP